MDAEVGNESNLIVDSGGYGEPVEVLQNGCDLFLFAKFHQNSGSIVLDVLKFFGEFQ